MISQSNIFGLNNTQLIAVEGSYQLHTKVVASYSELKKAALKQGIHIAIASSYRDFHRQLNIWNNKFSGKTPIYDKGGDVIDTSTLNNWEIVQSILNYSALPGTSRHHWGTDIDIFDVNAMPKSYKLQLQPDEYGPNGIFSKLSTWLDDNLERYGFYRPYLAYNGGVASELWHISHFELAQQYLKYFKNNNRNLLALLHANSIGGLDAIEDNFDYILDNYCYNLTPPETL